VSCGECHGRIALIAGAPLVPRARAIQNRSVKGSFREAPRERGLLFVGIDVIDGHLTEINVTSPTGIRAIAKLGGPDVAAMIWDAIEGKRGGK
jgi:glutathione synthase